MKYVAGAIGVIISGIICFIVFSLISKMQINAAGYTPSQSDSLIDIFIVVAPLCMVLGGFLSAKIYKNHRTKS